MPIYNFKCRECGTVFESILRLAEYEARQWPACPCGSTDIVRHFVAGHGGVQCDSINDVPWLPSALKTLPNDAARIESKTEWNRYLKENRLSCKG